MLVQNPEILVLLAQEGHKVLRASLALRVQEDLRAVQAPRAKLVPVGPWVILVVLDLVVLVILVVKGKPDMPVVLVEQDIQVASVQDIQVVKEFRVYKEHKDQEASLDIRAVLEFKEFRARLVRRGQEV
jgi:hypothetical protein